MLHWDDPDGGEAFDDDIKYTFKNKYLKEQFDAHFPKPKKEDKKMNLTLWQMIKGTVTFFATIIGMFMFMFMLWAIFSPIN